MAWGDKIKHFERLREKGRELPAGYLKRPNISYGLQFFWKAFWTLSTDRQAGFGLGPIPFSAIDRFACRHGIADPDEFDRFSALIRAMDAEYLEARQTKGSKAPTEVPIDDLDGLRGLLKRAGKGRAESAGT